METKMITIPFEVERAKRIQAGEEPGKITIRAGRRVRIVCWDMNDENYPIAGIITNYDGRESIHTFTEAGRYSKSGEDDYDLCILIPEWTQYKDGDILVVLPEVVVIFNRFEECTDCCKTKFFVALSAESEKLYFPDREENHFGYREDIKGYANEEQKQQLIVALKASFFVALSAESEKLYFPDREENHFGYREDIKGYANEEQKQQLIVALKASTDPRAKKYLKRFFGIEEKQECEFEPFQQVLVRDDCKRRWVCALFNFYDRRKETSYPFVCIGGSFRYCIPYNDKTKHLLGTTDNWEE